MPATYCEASPGRLRLSAKPAGAMAACTQLLKTKDAAPQPAACSLTTLNTVVQLSVRTQAGLEMNNCWSTAGRCCSRLSWRSTAAVCNHGPRNQYKRNIYHQKHASMGIHKPDEPKQRSGQTQYDWPRAFWAKHGGCHWPARTRATRQQ